MSHIRGSFSLRISAASCGSSVMPLSEARVGFVRALIQVNPLALNRGVRRQTNDDDAPAPSGADGISECGQGVIDGNSG
ncbi:hypothetical protein PUN4_730052 [Paraburkholderia unamae]|nr:hypothetical protein PUN4_730052 [Paraburkholderia unamae]